jgi:hypothetical protein
MARLDHADYPLAHPFRHVSLLSLGGFSRDIPLQEMPDFIGRGPKIWVRSHLFGTP